MNLCKTLIIGWSAVWIACLLNYYQYEERAITLLFYYTEYIIKSRSLSLIAYVFACTFIPWAFGCALIILALWLIERGVK